VRFATLQRVRQRVRPVPAPRPVVYVHDFGGYDFALKLSAELARRGGPVRFAYCPTNTSPKGDFGRTAGPGLSIAPIALRRPFAKYGARRLLSEISYGWKAAVDIVRTRPRVVLSADAPVLSQALIMVAALLVRARFVFWLQDIFGVALQSDRLRNERLVYRIAGSALARLELVLLRLSPAVVAISDGFEEFLVSSGLDPDRIHLIPNWADPEFVVPGERDNAWAKAHELTDGPRLVYSGTLGLKHDPDYLVRLGAALDAVGGSMIVVSEGVHADELRKRPHRGVTTLTFQPAEELTNVLAAADVLVVVLESDASRFSVPSKVNAYLCAGRAILACVPPENAAARLVVGSGAGVVVAPGDKDSFVAAALGLLAEGTEHLEALGAAGRSYAEANFPIAAIADRFEALVRQGRP